MVRDKRRSSEIFNWAVLEKVHKAMKDEIADGPLGFHTARHPETGEKANSVQELFQWFLNKCNDQGHLAMEDNVQLCQKIYPTVDEAMIRAVLTAYQTEVAPELFAKGMTDIRRSFIVYLYFAPFASLEEKMAFMFDVSDADQDGYLNRADLTDALQCFLKQAGSFSPQMEKVVGPGESTVYTQNLAMVYNDGRIDHMVNLCMKSVGENDKISKDAWKEWAKSPANLEAAFGRASQFLVTL